MMKKIDVVIGLNYGDEDKGITTDYLASLSPYSVAVVRYNSGAQAGHTVQIPNGTRHVFHHIGAGTFAGASTILSRHFVVNPILYFVEMKELLSKYNKLPELYVDPEALVTTPYDVFINQAVETERGNARHGSCGTGFNETHIRELSGYSLKMKDLLLPDLDKKIYNIRDVYLPMRLAKLGISPDLSILKEAHLRFFDDAKEFIEVVIVMNDVDSMSKFGHLIFEGAQGLSLDRYSTDFPHVTRSSTGLDNVMALVDQFDVKIDIFYVTRAYLTRHGAGPLKNEREMPKEVVDATNIPNDFQGTLRFAELDFDRMRQNVRKDLKCIGNEEYSITAVVTCCDQASEFLGADNLLKAVNTTAEILGTNRIITMWGPTRDSVMELEF